MVYYNNFPETSGSLSSLPIRENFDFLKVGLDVHASSSANPHATTLDQVCDVGAITDQAITVTSSGSVLKSLRVQNNELIGGSLEVKGNVLVDSSGSVLKSLRVQNNLQVGDDLFSKKIEHIVYAEHYVSIQDALDALPADGGIVIVPRGTIEISSTITVSPKKVLIGYGVECSTIKLADGSNCNMIEATSHYIHLEGFTLDGNKDNNTSGKGIYFDNVYVGSIIKDLIVSYCAEEGLHFSECSAFPVMNVWSHHNGKDQFLVESGSESVHLYNCTAEWNATYAGFHFKDTGPNACFGCHTEGCYYGVDIYNSDGIDIYNHYVDGACSGSVEAFTAVYIHGGSSNVIIQNVSILNFFSSGQIIFDEDNSYYIPETTLRCSYSNNNQYFRVLNLYNSGSSDATLLYSVGSGRFEFNDALYIGGDLELTGAIDIGTNTFAAGAIRARENIQVNSDYSSGDEDAPIYFNGTNALHEAEMRWDHGKLCFEVDKNVWLDSSLKVVGSGSFDDNIKTNGTIQALTSGSVLKSLNVVNNLQVGGDIIGNVVTTDTLDDVCERGAETDVAITITSSGSVLKSLRVQNNEQIGGSLEVENNITTKVSVRADGNIFINNDYSDLDAILYFGKPTSENESLRWDKDAVEFLFSAQLTAHGDFFADGNIYINADQADTNAVLTFYKYSGGEETFTWNGATSQFELSDKLLIATSGSVLKSLRVQNNTLIGGNLEVKGDITADNYLYFKDIGLFAYPDSQIYNEDGILNLGFSAYPQLLQITPGIITAQEDFRAEGLITAASSGSVLKSLRVQNNETVGGTLSARSNAIVNGYVQALTSGSVLKSLRIQNNEQIGGSLEVEKGIKDLWDHVVVVSKDNQGDYLTIQGAIDSITDNDATHRYCILVMPGIYDEVVITKNCVDIVGIDRGSCIIKSTSGNSLTIAYATGNSEAWIINISLDINFANYYSAVVAGTTTGGLKQGKLNFRECYFLTTTGAGALCVSGGIVTLKNCVVLSQYTNQTIYIEDSLTGAHPTVSFSDCIIDNSKSSGTGQAIIAPIASTYITIDNCKITATQNEAIYSDYDVCGFFIKNSTIKSTNDSCIRVPQAQYGLDFILENCSLSSNSSTYLIDKGAGSAANITMMNCTIDNNNKPSGLNIGSGGPSSNYGSYNVYINGTDIVQALTSGSVLKSLRVQNNEQIGGSLEVEGNTKVDGYIQALTSGSVLKSLRVQNNLQVGGRIIGGTKCISLPVDGAILPNNSAGNLAATIERIKSSAGAPSPHFMQAWFNSTTDSFLYWQFRMPDDYGSGLTAKVQYKMQTATSGSIVLGVAIMSMTPGDAQSVDTNDMGTVNSVTDTVPGTVKYLDEVSISLANTDSLVAGDFVVLYLMRDADNASDTAKGDLDVVAFCLKYVPM